MRAGLCKHLIVLAQEVGEEGVEEDRKMPAKDEEQATMGTVEI